MLRYTLKLGSVKESCTAVRSATARLIELGHETHKLNKTICYTCYIEVDKERANMEQKFIQRDYDAKYRRSAKGMFRIIVCLCKKNPSYKNIKPFSTVGEIQYLLDRDGAKYMITPSIHRFEDKKGYTILNCVVIEWLDHKKIHLEQRRKRKK